MKHTIAAVLSAGVFAASLQPGVVLAQTTDDHAAHAHEHGDAGSLSLNGSQRWETDAPLRLGMTQIRVASAMLEPAFAARQLPAAQAQQLVAAVRDSVATMIAQCQLAPEADANLHLILGKILAATSALESEPLSVQGIPALMAALDDYGHYFNHPGWSEAAPEDSHDHAH
jgi:hypothetical protein